MPPARTTNCGSPLATNPTRSASAAAMSLSINTIRPGCSDCAERTNPHTAAPPRSVMSSPANPTAPRVSTTSGPARSVSPHDCTTANTAWVAAYTEPTTPCPPAGPHSHTTTAPSPSVLPGSALKSSPQITDGRSESSLPLPCRVIGDHTSSNSRCSGPPAAALTAAVNCWSLTGRKLSEPTDNTADPDPSAICTETAASPTAVMRARTRPAPAACRDIFCQQNGSSTVSVESRAPTSPTACSTASSTTGCIPIPVSSTPASAG